MLTSFGVGEGTPVTIQRYGTENYNYELPVKSVDKFQEYSNEVIEGLSLRIKDIQDELEVLCEKGRAGKTDLRELSHEVDVLATHMNSNVTHLHESFKLFMESQITKAKTEVAVYTGSIVTRYGIEQATAIDMNPSNRLFDNTDTIS